VFEFDIDSKMSELLLKLAGNATVRGTINADGDHVGSVYSFINLACNKHGKFAYKVWEGLTSENSEYKDELKKLVTLEYVKGLSLQNGDLSHTKKTRLRQTPVMTLRGLQRLLMILGGRVAAEFRVMVEGVFSRYISGDLSMIEEIQSNAVSTAPIHHAYRQALAQEPVLDAAGTKRQLELEMEERIVALAEKKQALEERKSRMGVDLQEKSMQNVQTFAGLMTSLNPEWKSDARLRLQLEDSMKNAFFTPTQPLITNGAAQVPLTRSIDVSTVAQDLGMRLKDGEAMAIGIMWKKRYTETYGEAPSKHDQAFGGVVRKVCSYTERDRPMGESVIREYFSTHPR
jgi:hypothetical protein